MPGPSAHCLQLMAQRLPGDSRAGGYRWFTQRVDSCPRVLSIELVTQSVIPATVSTMPANAPGIMGRNQGALSPATPAEAAAGLREGLGWGLSLAEGNSEDRRQKDCCTGKGQDVGRSSPHPPMGDGSGEELTWEGQGPSSCLPHL